MPGRRTTGHETSTRIQKNPTTRILGGIRARLRKIFPKADETQLDDFTRRVLYYAKEERGKMDREVPVPSTPLKRT